MWVEEPFGRDKRLSFAAYSQCDEDHRHHLAEPRALSLRRHAVDIIYGEVYSHHAIRTLCTHGKENVAWLNMTW
jgi:hypothetical protein